MSTRRHDKSTGKFVLLTVGSTQFTPLVAAALSEETLLALSSRGFSRLIVQYGKQEKPVVPQLGSDVYIEVELHAFMDDIESRMQQADLVLCHAGAGSILAALRGPALSPSRRLTQLVIVPNDTLMDAHQSELADEMEKHGWAHVASVSTLAQVICELPEQASIAAEDFSTTTTAFPAYQPCGVQSILDEAMGYP